MSTKTTSTEWGSSVWLGEKNFEGRSMHSIYLKYPSAKATSLELEGDGTLVTPMIPRLVFTNLSALVGEVLKHPLLDHYHVKLQILTRDSLSPQNIRIQVDDPKHKCGEIVFQMQDGSPMQQPSASYIKIGTNEIYSYNLRDAKIRDLNLIVQLDVPVKEETVHFKLERIPLPWAQPTNLVVTKATAFALSDTTNSFDWSLYAIFKGGPLTNAAGIRSIWITKAEGDAGQPIEITPDRLWGYSYNARDELEKGGTVTKAIYLHSQLPRPKMVKSLEGDAELLFETPTSGVAVKLSSDLKPGEKIANSKLEERGVTFSFVGLRNFNAAKKELVTPHEFSFWSQLGTDKESATNGENSLLFSCADPRGVMLSHTDFPVEFDDAKGNPVYCNWALYTTNFYLFRFKMLPKKMLLGLYLVNRSAIRRVHFRVENIPLP